MKIVRRSKKIQSSSDLLQYTARYWAELIEEIESEGYKVDSADRHKPAQWITVYKDGTEYEIEVNKYSDGTYEIVKADLVGEIKTSCKSKKRAVKCADEYNSEDELEHPDQEYDSAATSINSNKLPAIYKLVHFEPGKVYLDFGGGKFENMVYFVKDKGATLLVYDPYNRSDEHNKQVLAELKENGGADAGLNSNVLNVIKEPEARLAVLKNLKRLVKPGGDIFITVYEGTGKGNEGPTKAGYQLNRKTADYLEEVQSVFPDAKRKGKLIHATNSGSVSSSRLIRSNCKITSTANNSIGVEIDAEGLKGKSREEIKQILDEAPVGAQVIHIRNLENRFNMDVLIRKKQAYKSNYFNPVGAPGDFNNLDTYWTVGGHEDPYIDSTIYKAVNGTDKYYGLTSEVLKAHGITSASYGGAYDVLDDYYFTRDDLVDFGEEVIYQLENLEPGDYFVNDLYMIDPKTIHIEVYFRDKEAYADKNVAIDMRRIHKPSDLNKYAYGVAADLHDEFSEYDIESASESTTGREFIELTPFIKAWEAMNMNDSDLMELESLILSDPDSGDIIKGSGGARKIRFQVQGKGKRGGARVIYVDFFRSEHVYLITAYPKSEKSDLSPREISLIRDIITDLE